MNDQTPTRDDRIANLKGMGCSRKRVEDARFTQGKGNYIDDIKLPGMLHGDFVRSPYAHARVKSINTDAAMALPGVVAVLTAKDLEPLSLHWMPISFAMIGMSAPASCSTAIACLRRSSMPASLARCRSSLTCV